MAVIRGKALSNPELPDVARRAVLSLGPSTSSLPAPSHRACEVRLARDDELEAVVQLRWRWAVEVHEPTGDEKEFVRLAGQWAREHSSTHLPHIAVDPAGSLLGMAWLALTPRVPAAGNLERRSGDLQSCFVIPGQRGYGIGGALVQAVLATARTRGVEHLTVHASPRSVNLYQRNGFHASGQLLWADLGTPTGPGPGPAITSDSAQPSG